MNNKKTMSVPVLPIVILLLLAIVTVCGICSFQTDSFYHIVNQYGETIQIWGAGIYAHDSYFKAPIFIGSDFTVLVILIPFAARSLLKFHGKRSIDYYLQNFSVMSVFLYYSASIAFGVTYNQLHLLYIILFGSCFYYVGFLFLQLYNARDSLKIENQFQISLGLKVFLIMSGISLIVAWLPDIITSLVSGTSLELIEVYTTEITYVLDIGIISPLMFLTLFLLHRNSFIGFVLLRMILKVCMAVGIMLPVQTFFQLMAGITIPLPALLTKMLVFVLLAVFAAYFNHRTSMTLSQLQQNH